MRLMFLCLTAFVSVAANASQPFYCYNQCRSGDGAEIKLCVPRAVAHPPESAPVIPANQAALLVYGSDAGSQIFFGNSVEGSSRFVSNDGKITAEFEHDSAGSTIKGFLSRQDNQTSFEKQFEICPSTTSGGGSVSVHN